MPSAEKLTIETPEQTSLDFPLAGIGSRFLALAIDTLLQGAFLLVLGIGAAILASANIFPARAGQWGVAALLIIFFLLEFGYFAAFEAVWNGQTPGKRRTHLRVIKDSGRPIGAQDAVLRNLLRIVDNLPTLYAAGIVTMLLSKENKRIGDYVAGTVVIHEKPLQGTGALWSGRGAATAAPAASQFSAPSPAGTLALTPALTDEELQLVETFLERRGNLEPMVRREMARQIAERLAQKASVPPASRPDAEQFLEALAEARRNAARFR